ncbi:YhcN/YlaJ family sporulation lipoprotein [Aneurinibacillus sp. BA2021]|nr:YhcN/YlaJ family sporulation lipoprotein [Aneurinibacillus sp. BA2021]
MKQWIQRCSILSLTVMMAGSLAACGQKAAPNPSTNTRTQSNQAYNQGTGTTGTNNAAANRTGGTQSYGGQYASYAAPGTAGNMGTTGNMYGTGITGTGTTKNMGNTGTAQQRAVANRAASVASKVPGVMRATAVAHGKDVVIGLDINNVARGRATIERDVQRAVKSAEPGYNVHVSADRGIHQRVRTLNDRMRAGHPIHTLTQDVGVLIRDVGRTITAPFR